jgi:uncharacterized coiled-coil DUF342 family protein
MASSPSFIDQFKGKISKLARLNQDFNNNFASRRSLTTTVIPSLKKINRDIKALYAKIANLKQQIDIKRGRVANNTSQINNNQAGVVQLTGQLTQLNIDKQNLEKRYADLKQKTDIETKKNQNQIEQSKRDISRLTYLNNDLNIHLSKLSQIATNTPETAAATATIQQQTQQNADIIQQFQNDIAQKDNVIAQLQQQLQTVSQQIKGTSQNISVTQTDIDQLNQQIIDLRNENDDLINTIHVSTQIINEAAQNLQELNNQTVNNANLQEVNQVIQEISKSIQDLSQMVDDSSNPGQSGLPIGSPQQSVTNVRSAMGSPSPSRSSSNGNQGQLGTPINLNSTFNSQATPQSTTPSLIYIRTDNILTGYSVADVLRMLNGLPDKTTDPDISTLIHYLTTNQTSTAQSFIANKIIEIKYNQLIIDNVAKGNITRKGGKKNKIKKNKNNKNKSQKKNISKNKSKTKKYN